MQLIKTNLYKIIISVLLVTYLFTNLVFIGREEVNPDAVNWHYRTEQFINGIKYFQFEKTYQHYHPGVTLMWVISPVIEITKQLLNVEYSTSTFLMFHTNVKIALVLVNLALLLICTYLLARIIDSKVGVLFLGLITLEPFFIANTRMFHMDALFTLLTFAALLLFYNYAKDLNFKYFVLAALAASLAILTRSVGIGLVCYFVLFGSLFKKLPAKYLAGIVLLVAIFCFVFFPALWVAPVTTIRDIFSESERIGIRDGHEQIFFGAVTEDPGYGFYPIVLLMKFTPILWLLVLLFTLMLVLKKNIDTSSLPFVIYTTIFYLGYFVVMSYASKKLDRYMLVLLPYFVLLASVALSRVRYSMLLFSCIFIYGIYSLIKLQPYYFTYTSPLFGSTQNANNIVGQKPFGIGMVDLRDFLLNKYGEVKYGFIDTKPMKSIYSNSKVFDIRITSSNDYDILVLFINEPAPDLSKFVLDTTFNINGLAYWRIYKKI